MKKSFIAIVLISGILSINSCKGKTDEATQETATTPDVTTTSETAAAVGEQKSYAVKANPEAVTIGKNKEATIKIINLKAIELTDPDGKVTGVELSYDYEVTNNNKVGGDGFVIDPAQFRLVLDNNNKISHESYDSDGVDAESTKTVVGNTFKLPAGTKPVALNLFFNETSASVKLEMK